MTEQLELELSDTWTARYKENKIRKEKTLDIIDRIKFKYNKLRDVEIEKETKEVTLLIEKESNWLIQNCPHPPELLEKKEYSCEGNYYDKGYSDSWTECTFCGATSEKKRTMGWYG